MVVLGIGINNSYSQWTQTDGPYGSSNVMVAFEYDSSYFASTYLSGFFSKSPLENSWKLHSDFYFNTFTIKGDSLFADAHYFSGGVSRDKGLLLFDLKNPDVAPIIISTTKTKALNHTDSCIFGGSETFGFFKLNYDGSGYTSYNNGLPKDTVWTPYGTHYETNVTAIEVTNDYIFSGTDRGIYRSDSNLINWDEKNTGLSIGNVTFIKEIQDTIYTSINGNLYYSSNNGNNWFLIYSTPSNITSFQKENNEMYLSTSSNGIFYSLDNGANWNTMNSGLTDFSVNFVFKYGNSILCGTKTKGVFQFQSNVWSDNNSGMISSYIRSITAANNQIISNSWEKVYKLSASGSWTDISPNVNYEFFASIESMNDTVFLSVKASMNHLFVIYSPNNGTSWQNLINPVPFSRDDPYGIYCDNSKLYAYEDEIMYYTNNLGLSWTDISLPSQFCNYFFGFLVYNSIPFAFSCGNGELLKLNNSSSWVLANNGLPTNRGIEGMAYCDSALFSYISASGMYVSFDNGSYWSLASNGLSTDGYIRDFAYRGQQLFVSTEDGVFGTKNYGQNWYACNDGLKNLNTSSLEILNDTLYVGIYGNGIWRWAIDDIKLSISEFNSKKYDIKIYPNPATNYFIIDKGNIEIENIKIIDLMGKHIISERFTTNKIDVQTIPNGIYILVLSSDGEIYNNKIIINR